MSQPFPDFIASQATWVQRLACKLLGHHRKAAYRHAAAPSLEGCALIQPFCWRCGRWL